jgi:two-component system nitrate/nitrite response regulator NarL
MHRLAAYLTIRERHCLRLLVEGLDTAQMAVRLGVSPATVRTHVQSLLTKLLRRARAARSSNQMHLPAAYVHPACRQLQAR